MPGYSEFVKVAPVEAFAAHRFIRFRILARYLAVFKEPDDSFYAIEYNCKHMNWDLSTGALEGDVVTCPRHGWEYNVRSGECLNHDSTPLRRYACKVEDGIVYVSVVPLEQMNQPQSW